MVQGADDRWCTMVNDGLYRQQKAFSAIYRAELAEGLGRLGYELERTHADGRFEIAGIPREVIEAASAVMGSLARLSRPAPIPKRGGFL